MKLSDIPSEQKKKFLIITPLLLIMAGWLYFKYGNNNTNNLELPESKIDKSVEYNSKLDNVKPKNFRTDTLIKEGVILGNNNPNSNDKIENNTNQPSYASGGGGRKKTPTNPYYNPYGRRNMWDDTPKQSAPQPSQAPTPKTKPIKPSPAQNNNNNKPIDYFNGGSSINSPTQSLSKEEKLRKSIANKYDNNSTNTSNQILATVHNNQTISSNNAQVRLRLKEPLYVNNTLIDTDAFIYANASVRNNNLDLVISSISYKGTHYPVSLIAYDYNTGQRGIPLTDDNIIGTAQKKGERELKSTMGSYGTVGRLAADIFSGRNKDQKIQVLDESWIYLKSK